MTIIKRKVTRNFTVIVNDCFDDQSLTGEMIGMFTYLRSRPHNWQVRIRPLSIRMKWGRDKTYQCLNALTDRQYIERRQERDESTGKFREIEYLVHDQRVAGLSSYEKPLTEMPLPENQKAAKKINTKSQKILPPKSPKYKPDEGAKGFPREEFRPSARVDRRWPERTAKPWAERGKYEAEIIARLGADGIDILSSLEEWKLMQLCRSQSRGALTDDQILELKTKHRTRRAP